MILILLFIVDFTILLFFYFFLLILYCVLGCPESSLKMHYFNIFIIIINIRTDPINVLKGHTQPDFIFSLLLIMSCGAQSVWPPQ